MREDLEPIPVAILGATGLVGQYFVSLLQHHPWFTIAALAASERSVGKRYGELVDWQPATPLSPTMAERAVVPCSPEAVDCPIVFSALDASVAGEIESTFARHGAKVFSNARNHRYDPDVPILVPEVNPSHASLVERQKGPGWIVCNPNCSAMGLAVALAPLEQNFGIKAVHVSTLQALSGAGFPGVSSLAMIDNVVPYIEGEEEKIERELPKMLGTFVEGEIHPASFTVSAHSHRVPVSHGHLAAVSLSLSKRATPEEILALWEASPCLTLPTAPSSSLLYFSSPSDPQPRKHRDRGEGMTVSLGRLRPCPLLDYKFVVLSHNAIRGGAGGALLTAEWMLKEGYLLPNSKGLAATLSLSGVLG